MKDYKIGTKLTFAFVSIILLVTISSVLSFFDINRINNLLKYELTSNFKKLDSVSKINALANSFAYSQLASAKTLNAKDTALFNSFATKSKDSILLEEKHLLELIGDNHSEKSLVKAMIDSKNNLDISIQQLSKIFSEHPEDGEKFFQTHTMDAWNNFQTHKEDVFKYYQNSFTQSKETIIANNQTSRLVIGIQFLFVVGLSALLGYFITRSITQPISEAVTLIKKIAQGHFDNLNQHRVFGKSESEELLSAIYTVNTNFRDIVSHLHSSSSQVQNAASEIAQGNQDLSSRTEEQAASLEETAATMEEITSTIQHTSENAHQANSLAKELSKNADEGTSLVKEVSKKVISIKESSQKIEEIISVINNIAFQTNILALNAAVEAARAGEHGRGFAVVASEVRALAKKSADSAKEIKDLILESTEKVNESVIFAQNVSEKIVEISNGFKKVSTLVEQINISATEQAHSVSQINEAISQMDQMTQQNASLVEESAAAASSLYQQSNDLIKITNQFKIN